MNQTRRLVGTALALFALLVLPACADGTGPNPQGSNAPVENPEEDPPVSVGPTPLDPSDDPAPTGPYIGTSGIGEMLLGAPAGESGYLRYEPDHCVGTGYPEHTPGSPAAARWVAQEPYLDDEDRALFSVETRDDIVLMIDIARSGLTTERGIGIGSTAQDIMDAYPGIQSEPLEPVDLGWVLYVVTDDSGAIGFAVEDAGDGRDGVVTYIRLTMPGYWPVISPATDHVAGSCL